MNKLKIFCILLTTCWVMSCEAATKQSPGKDDYFIHFDIIHMAPGKEVWVNLTTSVGNYSQGKCIYEKNTHVDKFSLAEGDTIAISGPPLKEEVGIAYACAKDNYEYHGKVVSIEYKLIKAVIAGQEEYTSSDPFFVHKYLPFP